MSPTQNRPPLKLLSGASLFLDFDGTLVELAERPDHVIADAALRALLARLGDRLDGRLALVSGRAAGDVAALVGGDELTIVGSHGMEFRWADGRPHEIRRPPAIDLALAEMRALAERDPGLLVEDKPLGAALHFRQRPDAGTVCVALASDIAARHALALQGGKMMVEVRANGGDKGTAIAALMREPEFAGTVPVFMGDDLTDEPGFAAASELGGAGILIGDARPSAARYRLESVRDALAWLAAAGEAIV